MTWLRTLVRGISDRVCRLLTLLDKGADDLCDCRADEDAGGLDPG